MRLARAHLFKAVCRGHTATFATLASPPATRGDLGSCASSIKSGQYAELNRTFSPSDSAVFAQLTGDFNAIHLDNDAAALENSPFERPIVHGMLCASLFSTLFATRVPGSIYANQELKFRNPVYFDEQVVARITVKKVRQLRGHTYMRCQTIVQKLDENKSIAIEGDADVVLPSV